MTAASQSVAVDSIAVKVNHPFHSSASFPLLILYLTIFVFSGNSNSLF